MAYDPVQNVSASAGVLLGARIEIFPSMPLPELNSPGGAAYVARYVSDATSILYAILCTSGLPPRVEAVQSMRVVDHPGVLRLIDADVVAWPDGTYAYALVYQRPAAPRMMVSIDETHPPLSEDNISHNFITPMIGALVSLANSGVVHNAIRPTNIFWRLGNATSPQIGECLSTAAGIGQPVLFESIERGQAMPVARGVGTHADDCYAFGVTLALLVMGRNPLQGMSDQAIIDLKMQRGTFGALVGNQRLSPTHIEILRGVLADDPFQRWSASDLDLWLNGRRMTPKSSDAGRRAGRHFDFMGKEYWQISPLVQAFAANPNEAAKLIENDSLNKWLRRALNDEERAKAASVAVHDLKQSGKTAHYEDQLVARICISLDPGAPLHYRGITVMPAGIAPLLVQSTIAGDNMFSVLSEIISSQLVSRWIHQQKDVKADYIALGQLFERLKGFVEKASLGNGVERVIYEANPGCPCLSPMLRNQYVANPKMLLPALERVAATGNRPREPLDRHIAAFLIVRDKRGENLFSPLSSTEASVRRGIALITLFADLQIRYGPERLPQLAAWLAPAAEPALRRFLSKTLRTQLQKQVKDVVATGNISQLLRLIDDPQRVERDRQDFIAARLLHLNIQKEIVGLEAKLNNRDAVVKAAGKPMAASISSFLAIILICAAVLRALLGMFIE